jgi:peroxiredoxin
MKFTLLLAIACLLTTQVEPDDHLSRHGSGTLPTQDATALLRRASDPPSTEVQLGDVAPNFSYRAGDGHWRHLSDIVAQGRVLLAFGADELTLRVIERERDSLVDLGVVPVALVEGRPSATQGLVKRLDLRYTVLADPGGIIAAQFNAVDPATGRQVPSWFVLDRKRCVRGLGRRGLPLRGLPALAANALGLPLPGTTLPTAR